MRVSTRIILGFGILMGLAVFALAYQVSVIHQLQSLNQDLSSVNFHAVANVLRMRQYGESIEELSQKFFVAPANYEGQLDSVLKDFANELADLKRTVRSNKEREEVERLGKALDKYLRVLGGEKNKPRPKEFGDLVFFHIFGHIESDHCLFLTKKNFGQRLSQLCFPNAGWA